MSRHETAEVFGPTHGRLRGILHRPAGQPRSLAMLLCYPFAEERKCAARVLTRAARSFCGQGMPVLRFDYRATGESDGDPARIGVGDWLEDIKLARQHLAERGGCGHVGVLGVRFGAALAAMAARHERPWAFLVAWFPVWTGRTCLEDCLRRLLATRLVMNNSVAECEGACIQPARDASDLGGMVLSPRLRSELLGFDAGSSTQAVADHVIVLYSCQRQDVHQTHERICRSLARPGGQALTTAVPGRPFWITASRFDPQPLVQTTLQALDRLNCTE